MVHLPAWTSMLLMRQDRADSDNGRRRLPGFSPGGPIPGRRAFGHRYGQPDHRQHRQHQRPGGPRRFYDEAKRYAEAPTMDYPRTHGVATRIVRIFNTFGERMRLDDGRVVPNFIGQALRREPLTVYGDGSQTRSFCYVSDLIDGIFRLLTLSTTEDSSNPVNIGNPREMDILAFAHIVNTLTDNPAGIVYK